MRHVPYRTQEEVTRPVPVWCRMGDKWPAGAGTVPSTPRPVKKSAVS